MLEDLAYAHASLVVALVNLSGEAHARPSSAAAPLSVTAGPATGWGTSWVPCCAARGWPSWCSQTGA